MSFYPKKSVPQPESIAMEITQISVSLITIIKYHRNICTVMQQKLCTTLMSHNTTDENIMALQLQNSSMPSNAYMSLYKQGIIDSNNGFFHPFWKFPLKKVGLHLKVSSVKWWSFYLSPYVSIWFTGRTVHVFHSVSMGALLLTWFNFNLSMDK